MQITLLNRNINSNNKKNNLSFNAIKKNDLAKVVKQTDNEIVDRFLCVVSGPSGCGKDSLLNGFDSKYGFFKRVVTCTTREPRIGEVDGVSYNFLSTDEFKKGIENDEFLEYANVFGDRFYGTRKKDVDEALSSGKNVVMCLDVEGAMTVKKKRPETVMMFITPPSLEELANRLINRGTESLTSIKERLNRADYELQFKDKYDVILENDDLYGTIEEMAKVFKVKK